MLSRAQISLHTYDPGGFEIFVVLAEGTVAELSASASLLNGAWHPQIGVSRALKLKTTITPSIQVLLNEYKTHDDAQEVISHCPHLDSANRGSA